MGRHKQWRKIVKRERRRKVRIRKAKERDLNLYNTDDQELLREQEALDLHEIEEIEKQNDVENEKWLQAEAIAMENWKKILMKRDMLRQKEIEQQAKLKLEWEMEKQKQEKEKQRLKKIEEENRQRQETFMSNLEKFLNGDSTRLPEELAVLYETRPECDLCPFFMKTACCRFGDECSRNHRYPGISKILLAPNMFSHFGLENANFNEYDTDIMLEYEDNDTYKDFKTFFYDILPEFQKFGKVVQLKVCNNFEKHLRGNTYIEYADVRSAVLAYRALHARWYGGKQLSLQFCQIISWSNAICGLQTRRRCPKGRTCNFLHVFRNPMNLSYRNNDESRHSRLLSCICEGTAICSCGDEIKQHILLPSRSIDFQTMTNKKDDETICKEEQNKNCKTEKTLNKDQNNKETQDCNEKTHKTKTNDEETSNKKENNEKTKDTKSNNDETQAKKDNIKVTLLSSVRFQPQNEPFRHTLPLVLTPRNISYDIFTGQDQNQSLKQRLPKRSADTVNDKENVKFKRFKSLSSGSLSGSSTSIDSNIMSLYSDTEILSDDSDPDIPGKDIDRHEIHCNKEIEHENEVKSHKEQPELLAKDKQEEEDDQPMEEMKNIEHKENTKVNHRVEIIRSQESSKANSENKDFCSGSTVLVRYFLKKSWKYFVGVILTVHLDTNMYTVSFYKTVKRNNILKFIIPKRKDEDTLPHLSIVKTVELLQINENPIECVLKNNEDEVYFT